MQLTHQRPHATSSTSIRAIIGRKLAQEEQTGANSVKIIKSVHKRGQVSTLAISPMMPKNVPFVSVTSIKPDL
jgi:hypothetical protein